MKMTDCILQKQTELIDMGVWYLFDCVTKQTYFANFAMPRPSAARNSKNLQMTSSAENMSYFKFRLAFVALADILIRQTSHQIQHK